MHSSSESPHPYRTLAVVVLAGLALAGSAWALFVALRDTLGVLGGPGAASVDEFVVAISAAGALLLLLWVCAGLLASALSTVPGRIGAISEHVSTQIAPLAVRRWAGVLLGVSILSTCIPGAAVAAPTAIVATVSSDQGGAGTTSQSSAPAPVWLDAGESAARPGLEAPEAAEPSETATRAPEPGLAPAPDWVPTPVHRETPVSLTTPRELPSDTSAREVTVHRGDTLWDLAAAHLPAGATDAEIATEWQRWYAENRAVIGDDPDLILPGQLLRVPASVAEVAP